MFNRNNPYNAKPCWKIEPQDIFVYDSTLFYILLQDRVMKKNKLEDNLWKKQIPRNWPNHKSYITGTG